MEQLTNLDRLHLQLGNKQYLSDEEYCVLLKENNIEPDMYYVKKNKRKLLLTVLDILKILQNDDDCYKKLSDDVTHFSQSEAFKYLSQRIDSLENDIAKLPLDEEEEQANSDAFLFFKRGW